MGYLKWFCEASFLKHVGGAMHILSINNNGIFVYFLHIMHCTQMCPFSIDQKVHLEADVTQRVASVAWSAQVNAFLIFGSSVVFRCTNKLGLKQ